MKTISESHAFALSRFLSSILLVLITTNVLNATPFGVRFLSFEVLPNHEHIELKWSTVEQENASTYYVERSKNGANWITVGYAVARTGEPDNSYDYRDTFPDKEVNYYRIRMEDRDGNMFYSVVRSATRSAADQRVLFPIPARDRLNIRMETPGDHSTPAVLYIANASGTILMTKSLEPVLEGYAVTINTNDFKPGLYVVMLRNKHVKWTGKFMKE